jgi:hypothetical protein
MVSGMRVLHRKDVLVRGCVPNSLHYLPME